MKKDRNARALALIGFEDTWRLDGKCIAGLDEVGRGPLAGPVLAACVVWPGHWLAMGDEGGYSVPPELLGIDDSKRVTPARREVLCEPISRHALAIGTGIATVEEIEEINIRQATHQAMRRAAYEAMKHMDAPADVYLLDGETIDLEISEAPVIGIKKGDTLSYAIASASIIAKVARDNMMRAYHMRYPAYGFDHNKGYGTAQHIAAIRKWGPCPIHRMSFLGNIL